MAAVSCAVPATDRPQGSLSVSVATDSSARSIRPDFEASIDTVNLTLALNGSATVVSKTFSTTNGAALFENLETGNWMLTADAFKAGAKVGTGSLTVAISGGSQSVVVPITFTRGSTASAFSIPLVWPASSGVDYATASIDGAAAAELPITATAATATAPATCAATVSSSLTPGAHSLKISFRRGGAAGTEAGTFVEYVNVYSGYTVYAHVKGDGSVETAWNFSASDFLGSNANLAGIAVTASGTPLDIGFSSATTAYTVGIGAATSVTVTPTGSIAGQYITWSLNGGAAAGLPSGSSASFTPGDANSLVISVRAPDGATTKNYTLTINKTGGATVSFSLNPGFAGLTVTPASTLAPTGAEIDFTVAASGAVSSAYDWYVDGIKNTLATGSTFTYDALQGSHSIGVVVTAGGIRYSGNAFVTGYAASSAPWYHGNGADSGAGPDDGTQGNGTIYVLWDNTTDRGGIPFVRSGYTFTGWNTKPDGTGTHYAAGAPYTFDDFDVAFYAQWANAAPSAPTNLTITANGTAGYATLSWTDPAEKDIAYVRVSDGTTSCDIAKGTQKKIFTGIAGNGTFTAQAYDNGGLPGPAATVSLVTIATEAEAIAYLQGFRGGTLRDSIVLACDVNLGAWTQSIATVTGMIDGGGHTITLGAGSTSGLFGTLAATSTVKNLAVTGTVSYPAGTLNSTVKFYGLLSTVSNGNLVNCSAKGSLAVNIDTTDLSCVGGIAGYISTTGIVRDCWSEMTVSVTAIATNHQLDVGGFTGYLSKGTVTGCYNISDITITCTTARQFIGGFVGKTGDAGAFIRDCYARGAVTAGDVSWDDYIGGFAGTVSTNGLIERCYSTGRVTRNGGPGLAGGFNGNLGGNYTSGPGAITDCLYDSSTSGETGTFATGKPTADMKAGNFANWDFGSVWGVDPAINDGYPYLRSFGTNTVTP
jgi:hypothetical protein